VRSYKLEDADTVIVALGSVLGTIKDTVDEMREAGVKIGVLGIKSFRPFPLAAVRAALQRAKRLVVIEKSLAVGIGGIVATDVRMAMSGSEVKGTTVIAGLGGRAITKASLHRTLAAALEDKLDRVSFMDLDTGMVERHLQREREKRRTGPIAEALLRDVGTVGARVV
jgi:pyruvate ferredoxin oxidoreductase alpha subunit